MVSIFDPDIFGNISIYIYKKNSGIKVGTDNKNKMTIKRTNRRRKKLLENLCFQCIECFFTGLMYYSTTKFENDANRPSRFQQLQAVR